MNVNADVLLIIFTLLSQGKRAPLLSASRVNRTWHSVAQVLIEKTIDLTICAPYESRNLEILKALLQRPEVQARAESLVISDCHTTCRVPLGVADGPSSSEWIAKGYFAGPYELADPDEPFVLAQLDMLQMVISTSRIRAFTWAAIPPLPYKLCSLLATIQTIRVHLKLNSGAVDTAAWSWTPVANLAVLRRVRPLAANLSTLQLLLPHDDQECHELLSAVAELIGACSRLQSLSLRTLGKQPLLMPQQSFAIGLNGPPAALAHTAETAEYKDWSMGSSSPSPSSGLSSLLSTLSAVGRFSSTLTTLVLHNFCICDAEDLTPTVVLHALPALLTVQVSCVRLLKQMQGHLPRLCSLALTMAEGMPYFSISGFGATECAGCKTFFQEPVLTETLLSFDKLRELKVYGNTEAIGTWALMHLGKTLRTLELFRRYPLGHKDTIRRVQANSFAGHSDVLSDGTTSSPSFLHVLGQACPMLEALSCDAPNASTEFDAFLEAVVLHLPNLKALHIRRSLEPYCDTVPTTKYSYARFTAQSVAAIWERLHSISPRLELTVTIGSTPTWDQGYERVSVAPEVYAMSFSVIPEFSSAPINGVRSISSRIIHFEQVEAELALAQQRPGPLRDYWQVQSGLTSEHAQPKNIPIAPKYPLVDGVECQLVHEHPTRSARRDPAWKLCRRQQIDSHETAIQAQHAAELEEATNPSRAYY